MITVAFSGKDLKVPWLGDKLPNGSVLVAETVTRFRPDDVRESVVLCVIPDSVDAYCVWRRYLGFRSNGEQFDYCESGSYHRDSLQEALVDYNIYRAT